MLSLLTFKMSSAMRPCNGEWNCEGQNAEARNSQKSAYLMRRAQQNGLHRLGILQHLVVKGLQSLGRWHVSISEIFKQLHVFLQRGADDFGVLPLSKSGIGLSVGITTLRGQWRAYNTTERVSILVRALRKSQSVISTLRKIGLRSSELTKSRKSSICLRFSSTSLILSSTFRM